MILASGNGRELILRPVYKQSVRGLKIVAGFQLSPSSHPDDSRDVVPMRLSIMTRMLNDDGADFFFAFFLDTGKINCGHW